MSTLEFDAPIFIVGSARSGTSLLASALSSHRRLVVTPEILWFSALSEWEPLLSEPQRFYEFLAKLRQWSQVELDRDQYIDHLTRLESLTPRSVMDTLYAMYMARSGKQRCGDKTNLNIYSLPVIASLWPNAVVIHTIRDGRDVVTSQLEMPPFASMGLEALAGEWKKRIQRGRADSGTLKSYLEIRYEDLVNQFEPQMRKVCEFVGEEFDPNVLRYYELDGRQRLAAKSRNSLYEGRAKFFEKLVSPPDVGSIGRWRAAFSPIQAETFSAVAGDLLAELGYARG